MTILEQVVHYQAVWRLILPHIQQPAPEDCARWLAYPVPIVEQALIRSGQRFTQARLDVGFEPSSAYRYVTATANRMSTTRRT
jgi:hypothetical protein